MKIYHKKNFAWGLLCMGLGVLNLAMNLYRWEMEIKDVILIPILFFIGVGNLIRSMSLSLSQEDRREEGDERNQLIRWKSQSKAFRITQGLSFLLMIAALTAGAAWKENGLMGVGLGMALTFSLMVYIELFASIYYEFRD